VVPVIAYHLFRLGYYGDFVANSARAKVEGIPLSFRLTSAWMYVRLHDRAWLPAFAVCAGVIAVATDRRAAALIAMTLPLWLGLVVGGGDHMPEGRMLVPIMVLAAVAAGIGGKALHRWAKPWAAAAAFIVAALQWHTTRDRDCSLDAAAAVGAQVGRYLESALEPGTLVATATAGSTPYYAPSLQFIDTLGLNDRHIARRAPPFLARMQAYAGHAKGDGAYVLSRAPDVILLGPAEGYLGEDDQQWFLTDTELLRSPEFRALYAPYLFHAPVRPEDATHWRMRMLLDGRGMLQIIAWLRVESPRAEAIAVHGVPLIAP
jgi:hypothetical protein